MKCTELGLLSVLVFTQAACGDDTSGDPIDSTTSGGSTGDPATPTGDPTTSTTEDPGTDSVEPATSTGGETTDPGSTSEEGTTAGTTNADTGSSDETGGAGTSTWTVEVEVDLGGTFDVTAEAIIILEADSFTSDVTTQIIAGGKEVHEVPLAGTFDGSTLTMTDSPFTIVVGKVTEDFLLSGTATIDGESLTGSGTFTSSFDGGEPFPGSYTITNATLIE